MKLFTIISVLVFMFASPLFAGGEQEEKGMMEKTDSMMMGPIMEFEGAEKAMMQAEEKPTVLFFHASWCPSCKAARKDFEENIAQLDGINLLIVDYDTSKDLQEKYGVTYQHTFVQIDSKGMELAKWNGGGTEELLDKVVKPAM